MSKAIHTSFFTHIGSALWPHHVTHCHYQKLALLAFGKIYNLKLIKFTLLSCANHEKSAAGEVGARIRRVFTYNCMKAILKSECLHFIENALDI